MSARRRLKWKRVTKTIILIAIQVFIGEALARKDMKVHNLATSARNEIDYSYILRKDEAGS